MSSRDRINDFDNINDIDDLSDDNDVFDVPESLSNPTRLSPIARPSASPRRGFRTVGFEPRSNEEPPQSTDQVTSEFLRLSSIDVASSQTTGTLGARPRQPNANARRPRTRPIQRVAPIRHVPHPQPAEEGYTPVSAREEFARLLPAAPGTRHLHPARTQQPFEVPAHSNPRSHIPRLQALQQRLARLNQGDQRHHERPQRRYFLNFGRVEFHFRGTVFDIAVPRRATFSTAFQKAAEHIGAPIEGLEFYLLCFKVTEHYLKCEDYNVFQDTPLISRRIDIRFKDAIRQLGSPPYHDPSA
jgi:hypothetical protein